MLSCSCSQLTGLLKGKLEKSFSHSWFSLHSYFFNLRKKSTGQTRHYVIKRLERSAWVGLWWSMESPNVKVKLKYNFTKAIRQRAFWEELFTNDRMIQWEWPLAWPTPLYWLFSTVPLIPREKSHSPAAPGSCTLPSFRSDSMEAGTNANLWEGAKLFRDFQIWVEWKGRTKRTS